MFLKKGQWVLICDSWLERIRSDIEWPSYMDKAEVRGTNRDMKLAEMICERYVWSTKRAAIKDLKQTRKQVGQFYI